MKKVISTTKAPAAIGPYSQAIEANGFVFASGQIPVNPETGEIVKTSVFIKNMDDFATINGIYAKYFEKDCPARSCVEIARLPKDVLLEMEAIAVK